MTNFRKIIGASATVALLGAGLIASAPAHAASTCPTVNGLTPTSCITSVTLSRTTATISGAASVPVTVAIGMHSVPGIPSGPAIRSYGGGQPPDVSPELYFNVRVNSRTSGRDRLGLALESGDAHDGVWQGTINVSALDAGTLTTSFVDFGGLGQPPLPLLTIPVALRRSVIVSATHTPTFASSSLAVSPDTIAAGAAFTVAGRVIDARTGAGMARVTVYVQEPDQTCTCFLGRRATTTNANGYWHILMPALDSFDYRASIEGPANSDGRRADIALAVGSPNVVGSVVAKLSAQTAHRGQLVLATGTASPAAGQRIVLEKWVSHTWRVVATTALRPSGRFTLPANPTATGHWEYRVTDSRGHAVSAILFLDVN